MATIMIDRTADDETPLGIEFTRVYFTAVGPASREEIDATLGHAMDDLCNLEFDPATGKGYCVTIDQTPNVGSVFETSPA